MDWRSRHKRAAADARRICHLDSFGHAALTLVIAITAIAFLWVVSGQTEAWSEFLVKVGVLLGLSFAFPSVYLWKLLEVQKFAEKRIPMLLIMIGIAVMASGAAVTALGVMQFRKLTIASQSGQAPATVSSGPVNWNQIFGTSRAIDRVFALLLDGKSVSTNHVQLKEAFLESGITGERIEMKVYGGPSESFLPSETNPIPPGAFVRLIADVKPPTGLENKEFLETWRRVWFNAIYENEKPDRILFDEKVMESYFPGLVGPRVTKKSQ